MKKKITSVKNTLLLCLIGTFFLPILSIAQTDITTQGFDLLPADTWTYTSTLNTGGAVMNNTRFVSAPNSLRLQGSSTSGSGPSNNDPYILFSNQSLVGYTNAMVTLSFSSTGSPDTGDDLYLDVSYDNGLTFPSSVRLLTGQNSSSQDNLGFSHAAIGGTTVGSAYTFAIPNLMSQVRIRIRFNELDNQNNTADYYFVDNVKLSATPTDFSLDVFGSGNPIAHNSNATTFNATDFGTTLTSTNPVTNTFTIKNTGTGVINLTGAPLISLIGSTDFSVVVQPSTPIAKSGSTTFQVRFNPTSSGLKTATVSIASNDNDENPFLFQIKGFGSQTFFDSDGDGILDNVDIDDDNDGIADNTEEAYCDSSNGIKVSYNFLNETFGAGAKTIISTTYNASTTYCYEDGIVGPNTAQCPSQSSWILDDGEYCVTYKIAGALASDPENIHGDLAWYNGEDHTIGDTNGRMAVFNASFVPGTFYETTITGVLANTPITYSFWALNIMSQANYVGTILPNITVEFFDLSNNLLGSYNTGDIGRCSSNTLDNTCGLGVWKQFSTSINLGNINAFVIRFRNNAPGGGGNDLALDDIVISQLLCDLDNDGVADVFDLDSDNDGLEDILEIGLGNLSNGKGKMDVAWLDGNANGMHDSAESLVVLDSDNDGIPNYIDLDSDNDTLFDVDESGAGNSNAAVGFINGDGDINGDGVGDAIETESFRSKDTDGDGINEYYGDGILDIYDYGVGVYGNLNQGTNIPPYINYLLDTDGDGKPDYIDLTSNGVTFDISKTLYASLDANNNGIIDGSTDIDKDGIIDRFDTNTTKFGSPRNLERKLFVEFDGRNDYAEDTSTISAWPNATLMAWINLNNTFSADGIIFGQNNFRIGVDAALKPMVIANGTTVKSNTAINKSQWIHVAGVYDSGNGQLKLYVNGQMVKNTAASGSLAADATLLTIGKNPAGTNMFFKGNLDELRLFNVALTDSQIQKMVYQEIMNNAGQVRGEIVPKDIPSLPWTNLKRYYRMDNFKDNVIDNHTTAAIDVLTGAKIYNVKTIKPQEAPLPFITEQAGNFATASNSVAKQIRGQDVLDYNWAIIEVKHNIVSTSNHTNVGMFVDPSVNVEIANDSKLQNDWYLKLDGTIDLQGKSQLIQTFESDLDPASIGKLERDQQGTGNKYNYNYWSSPVSTQASIVNNNTGYTIQNALSDGTNPASPQSISWIEGYDGSANPMKMARFWLYKFTNMNPSYANWQQINENTVLQTGQGFTMKGSGIATPPAVNTQNYVFTGKPNNGTINHSGLSVAANYENLIGNPYPSALDANAFISDNAASTTGALYFWEHYRSNNSHNLSEYQGGYAARNLVGGTIPVSPSLVSGLGSSSRVPARFVPVGAGFFIKGSAAGGPITFKNSQRLFVKEDDPNSNIMFKNVTTARDNNSNDPYEQEAYTKIRLGYNTTSSLHRQLLVGFMDGNATSALDYGYDAEMYDVQNNDIYFPLNEHKLVIQGLGQFNSSSIIPLAVKSSVAGPVTFILDGVENFDENQPVYIHDNLTNTYHDITVTPFELELPAGEIASRFTLRFTQENLGTPDHSPHELNVYYAQESNILHIRNELADTTVKKVTLYNVLAQKIKSWNPSAVDQSDIQFPIVNMSAGTYIVNLETSKGDPISTKIIIR